LAAALPSNAASLSFNAAFGEKSENEAPLPEKGQALALANKNDYYLRRGLRPGIDP
jgi:hypothetical protein